MAVPCVDAAGMRLESAKIDLSGTRQLGHSRTCFSCDDVAVCHVRFRCIHYEAVISRRGHAEHVSTFFADVPSATARRHHFPWEFNFARIKSIRAKSPHYAPRCFRERLAVGNYEVEERRFSAALPPHGVRFLTPDNFRPQLLHLKS